jgi:uncharacterized protein involved in tolerance to divalent cations
MKTKVAILLKVEQSTKERLKNQMAAQHQFSMSELIRMYIEQGLSRDEAQAKAKKDFRK